MARPQEFDSISPSKRHRRTPLEEPGPGPELDNAPVNSAMDQNAAGFPSGNDIRLNVAPFKASHEAGDAQQRGRGGRKVKPSSKYALTAAAKDLFDGSKSSSSDYRYVWEMFPSKSAENSPWHKIRLGPEVITTKLGLIGIEIVRVWKKTKHNVFNFFAHFWHVPSSCRYGAMAVLIGLLLPAALDMVQVSLPLRELSEPVGSDGFWPMSDIWGWILQKSIVLLFVDLIMLAMEMIYLKPDDHFYFDLWPTVAKILLTLFIQDFMTRIFGAFPVPLLDNLIGPPGFLAIQVYRSYVFVKTKLPQYEKGIAEPALFEGILSCGRNTKKFTKRLKNTLRRSHSDPVKRASQHQSLIPATYTNHFRRRSVTGDSREVRSMLPSYTVFQRRRFLVLMALTLTYSAFYLTCVTFLLFFRLTSGDDGLQALLAIGFSLTSVVFRKGIIPLIFHRARYGGKLWDGEYHASLSRTEERSLDDRLNVSGFKLADYFFECLSEMFLTFILPEISSDIVFVLILFGELGVVLFTGASWVVSLPSWSQLSRKRSRKAIMPLTAFDPHERMNAVSPSQLSLHRPGLVDRLRSWNCRSVVSFLSGIPSRAAFKLLEKTALFPHTPRVEEKAKRHPHGVEMALMSPTREGLKRLQNELFQEPPVKTSMYQYSGSQSTFSDMSSIQHEFMMRSLSRLVDTPELPRQRRHSISTATLLDISPEELVPGRQGAEYEWAVTNPREEFVLLGWVLSRCQTLFMMFFADLYATFAFFFVFSFMVFGHNSESFPYSEVCSAQYRTIMEYNGATFITNVLAIGICDLVLRHKLGISLVSTGLAVFSNSQMVVPMTITAILSYLLVWGLIVDHARSLLFLTELFGSSKLSDACIS
eukprot:gb/GECG01004696.1/.p1 GENE.gb/GECG01004696.1/~~gb/GECG01004696.1/.p1  ORF type:complete len:871 (+),score=57.04 gb/GECG01004696.1/:1-2613(+)